MDVVACGRGGGREGDWGWWWALRRMEPTGGREEGEDGSVGAAGGEEVEPGNWEIWGDEEIRSWGGNDAQIPNFFWVRHRALS